MTDMNEVEAVEAAEEATEEVVASTLVYQGPNSAPDKPGCIEIIAKKDGKEARVFYDFGDNLSEMAEMFGEDAVFSNARGKMVISLQAAMRGRLKANQSIEALMAVYKPGVTLERVPTDMTKATEDYFAGLSGEEQDAMIERLMSAHSKK